MILLENWLVTGEKEFSQRRKDRKEENKSPGEAEAFRGFKLLK
jgi:hypothetical protein